MKTTWVYDRLSESGRQSEVDQQSEEDQQSELLEAMHMEEMKFPLWNRHYILLMVITT